MAEHEERKAATGGDGSEDETDADRPPNSRPVDERTSSQRGVEAEADAEGGEPAVAVDPAAAAAGDRDRLKDQLLRLAADFDNYRKRSRREVEEARIRGRDDMLRDLLPVLDNFERALVAASQASDPSSVVSGLEMVQKLLSDTLSRAGLEAIQDVGVPFDPSVHDAIQQEATNEAPPGSVIRLVQKGYRSGERLIRPASVVVATPGGRDSQDVRE